MSTVHLIFGEDEFLVTGKAKELVDKFLPEADRVMGLEVIDGAVDTIDAAGKALGQCFEALQTMGFFAAQKVVWFRDVSFLADNVIGKSESIKTKVEQLAEMIKAGIPDGQILLITSPKVNKKYRFYKACESAGELHEFAVSDKSWQNEKDVAEFLRITLNKYGLQMNRETGSAFLEKVGTNSRQIGNEVEKMSVYLGDRKEVKLADIEQITASSKSAISWDLADAVGHRKLDKALHVTRQLLFQKESAIGIIMGLNSRIRDLIIYRDAIDKGWLSVSGGARGNVEWRDMTPDAEKMFSGMARDPRKMHPFRLKLLVEQAARFSTRELKKCQKTIMEAYEKLVSSSMPDDLTLELMLIKMLS